MATRLYMAVLGAVLAVAILAGMYHELPPWLVWILGIAIGIGVGVVALIVLGTRILRGDFRPHGDSRGEDP